MSDRPAVLVDGVRKQFGSVQALDGIDLEVPSGTVLGLLGPNGAGKTTAVRILTTLLRPDAGRAEVAGYDVVRDAEALRSIIGLAGQYAAVDANLSGRENLELVGRLYHLPRRLARRRSDELLDRFELDDAAHRLVKGYSGGMRRRLDLAASLVGEPEVLFLDEPTTGLDLPSRLALWEVIERLVGEGRTVLLSTQYLEEADRLADTIAVIDHGRVIAEGTASELKAKVGGDLLELTVRYKTHVARAAKALAGIGSAEPKIDDGAPRITVPVAEGANVLAKAVRNLDRAKVSIADLAVRRPTLDDVFLALTGHAAEEVDGNGSAPVPEAASRAGGRT